MFVTSRHSRRRRSEPAEHPPLHVEFPRTRLSTRSPRVWVGTSPVVTIRRGTGPCPRRPPFATSPESSPGSTRPPSPPGRYRRRSARPHLEPAEEECRGCRHQAGADEPTVAPSAAAPRGTPAGFDTPLDDIERVDRRLRLRPREQVSERPPPRRSPPGAQDAAPSISRAPGTARAPVVDDVSTRARAPCRTTSETSDRSAAGSRLPRPPRSAGGEARSIRRGTRPLEDVVYPSRERRRPGPARSARAGCRRSAVRRHLPGGGRHGSPQAGRGRGRPGEAEMADVQATVRTSQYAISSPPPSAAPFSAGVGTAAAKAANSSRPASPPARRDRRDP